MATLTAASMNGQALVSAYVSRQAKTSLVRLTNATPVINGSFKNCYNSTGRYTLGSKGMTVSTGIVQYWS